MKWCFVLAISIPLRAAYAQDIVEVTTQVLPPFEAGFSNFHTKVLVTLRNTTGRLLECRLSGTLASDNVTITLPESGVPPIILTANQIMQLTGPQLAVYFQEQNVSVAGTTKQELYHGSGLPGGNYQLCLRAVSILNNEFLSSAAPSGCFMFTIQQDIPEDAVRLTTQVIPPYSTYLEDYINQNKLMVVLQNRSGTPQELRLIGTIKGNNGVTITIPPSFVPSRPIVLSPRQVLQLVGNDLREYFGEDVLQYAGISRDDVARGNGLPEGNYQICLQALDYNTGEPRSPGSPLGCAMFDLRQYEPPIIIQPACNTTVNATQPQNILFTWSIPGGVRPDLVEYVLKIVEMYPQSVDPNQAVQAANIPPLFEKVVRTNSYVYTLADPKLEIGKTYAFRVTARMNTASRQARRSAPLNFRNNGNSQVCTFTFGAAATNEVAMEEIVLVHEGFKRTVDVNPIDVLTIPAAQSTMAPDPEDSQACSADCNVPAPANTSSKSIAPGDEVKVGKFTMTVTTGNATAGTGRIAVNFLNTPINVQWNNIQVNTDNEVFGNGSKITAGMDFAALSGNAVTTQTTPNPNLGSIASLMQTAQQASRRVSMFPANNSQSIGLPVTLDQGNFNLVILGLIFTPTGATMNAITAVELTNSTAPNDYLVLATSTCIRPNGFGDDTELVLADNKTIPLSNRVSMILQQNATKATFDCQGIDAIEVSGTLRFDRDLVLPVNASGEVVGGDTRLSASFSTTITNYNNWTASINSLSHAFTIPELVGFKFEASNITLDHSSSSNPAGANNAFPANYPGQGNAWTGIYIGSLTVTLPSSLKDNNAPISFGASHVLLDKNGFTGNINPPAAILANGQLGGWNFSINDFSLNILSSTLVGAGMGGTLQIPISIDELEYEVAFETSTSEDDEVDFHFQISTTQAIDVDMWFAELDLDATSTITIAKEGMVYRPEAILHGNVTISWNPSSASKPGGGTTAVSNINIPDLRFENFRITGGTSPSISLGAVQLDNFDNDQAGLAGFPLVLNSVSLNGLDQSNIKLQFDMDLSLNAEGNGISGGTVFSIVGKFNGGHYNYDHTELNEVSIDVDVGVAYLLGSITIFNNDAVYGDGFRGEIQAKINAINLGMDAALQIGRTTGANSFRYWYFDLMVNAGTGIPIPGTAAAIYGLGGGAYHNMTRNVMQEMSYSSFNNNPSYSDTPGASVYGSTFTPSQGSFGFNAAVAFGLAGVPSAFNGDVKFSMELDQDGSFDNVIIEGGGYVMQDFTGNRNNAFIKGSVKVVIVPHDEAKPFPTPVFHLETEDPFTINIASIITGQVPLAMHFDPEVWYVKLGEWENYDEPWLDNKRIELGVDLKVINANFYGYFMMGNDIPEIPPMPAVVRDVFGMSATTTPRGDVLGTNNSGGVAFGAGFKAGTDPRIKFLIFYADILFTTGFDVTLKHYQGDMGCGSGFGIHGWYAKGQMYAYLGVDVGLEVKVWFTDGKLKLSLLQATAAAALQAQLPNPTWVKGQFAISGSVLNGLIKVNTSFKFEVGEKCIPDSGNPFEDMPIISEVNPGNGDTKVSVFTNPEVAFNFPNEEFQVEEIRDDGSTVVRTFYYTFESFILKYKDDLGNNRTMDITNWKKYRQDGNSAVFVSSEVLPADRPVSYEVRVRGWEKVFGPDKLLITEKKEGTFTTDKFPDHILFTHIKNSRPGYRQRYFLKDEYQKGEIDLMYNYSDHFDPEFWYEDVWELGNYNHVNSGTFRWEMRFRELATGNVYPVKATISADGTKISFNIPNALKNSTIYKADLVVIYNPPVTDLATPTVATNTYAAYKDVIISGSGGGGGSTTINNLVANQGVGGGSAGDPGAQFAGSQTMTAASGSQQMLAANYQLAQQVNPGGIHNLVQQYDQPNGMYQASLNKGMLTAAPGPGQATGVAIQRMNRKLVASDESSKTIEHNLFKFFFAFKTSKFNTKQQKINSMEALELAENKVPVKNYATFYPGTAVSTDVPVALLSIEENFDAYELYGKKWGNSDYGGFIEPVFKLKYQDYEDQWLESFIEDLYDMPDDEEWEYMVIKDEFGIPIEWTVDRPTPDWEQYIPAVDDWNQHRHENKWYPFGKRDFPSAFQMMSGYFGAPMLEFYGGSNAHGSIDWKGQNVVLPDGPLSAQEVQDAMELAPTPPSGNLNQFQANTGYTPPTIGNQQYANPTLPKRIAVLDYTEWLSMRDFYLFRKHIHERNLDLLPSPSDPEHNEYHDLIFVPIEYYLQYGMYYKSRPKGGYFFEIEGNPKDFYYIVPELNKDGGFYSEN